MGQQPRKDTRARLLDAAEEMINTHGFAATSIDKVIEEVGVTKGSFFYHFKSKQALALALIQRFAEGDQALLRTNMERAEKLSDDPLQQLFIFIGLIIEVAEGLDETPNPGCLFATYCFESGLFKEETNQVISEAMAAWTVRIEGKLKVAKDKHGIRKDVDLNSLAEMVTVLFEGAYVLARTFPGRKTFSHQMRHYRNYVQLLFGLE